MPSNPSSKLNEYLTELENSNSSKPIDVDSLKEQLQDHRIIAMGEATHSSSEFYRLRHEFFRYLAKEHGYRIFAWEASFGETLKINEYVLNGKGNPEELVKSMSTPPCQMEEVVVFIKWIRNHNKDVPDSDKIRFYGFDMQNDTASFRKLREILDRSNSKLISEYREVIEFIGEGRMILEDIEEPKRKQITEFTQELKNHVKEENFGNLTPKEFALLKQLSQIVEQSRKYCFGFNNHLDIDSWTFRDKSMAENISHIMDMENEDKIFISAHNAHIKKGGKPEEPDSLALGYYLNQKFGDNYYAIGFDFGKGSFKYLDMESQKPEWDGKKEFTQIHENTLAEDLKNITETTVFLDIKSALESSKLESWLNREHRIHSVGTYFHKETLEDHYDSIKLPKCFDALIFIPEITASKPVN